MDTDWNEAGTLRAGVGTQRLTYKKRSVCTYIVLYAHTRDASRWVGGAKSLELSLVKPSGGFAFLKSKLHRGGLDSPVGAGTPFSSGLSSSL